MFMFMLKSSSVSSVSSVSSHIQLILISSWVLALVYWNNQQYHQHEDFLSIIPGVSSFVIRQQHYQPHCQQQTITTRTIRNPMVATKICARPIRRRRRRRIEYDDDEEDVDNDYYFDNENDYFDEDEDEEDDNEGYYIEDDEEEEEPQWEWEKYQKTTHVFLPPPILNNNNNNNNNNKRPKTILHFIGGTLFGSYPLQCYKPFLEQIAIKSNSIMVVTSIPIDFKSNPLDHTQLCLTLSKAFRGAYDDVICDEFDDEYVREEMKIVGLGHSLGSRLHCIISSQQESNPDHDGQETNVDFDNVDDDIDTIGNNNNDDDYDDYDDDDDDERRQRNKSKNRRRQRQRPRRKRPTLQQIALKRHGNILLSFNNYSASSSVPGIKSLEKNVKATKLEQEEMIQRLDEQRRQRRQLRQRRKNRMRRCNSRSRKTRSYNDDDDEYYYDDDDDDDDEYLYDRRRRGYDYDYDDEDDIELRDIVTSIKSSLTPDNIVKKASSSSSSSLEFKPSPDELWDMVLNCYGNSVDKTLMVQFDNDRIDQSARLAREIVDSIKKSGDSGSSSVKTSQSSDNGLIDESDNDDGGGGGGESYNTTSTINNSTSISGEGQMKDANTKANEERILFARLKGTHLSPVSYSDSFGLIKVWKRLSALPMDDLLKEAIDVDEKAFRDRRSRRRKSSRSSLKQNDLNQLTDCIARYIEIL